MFRNHRGERYVKTKGTIIITEAGMALFRTKIIVKSYMIMMVYLALSGCGNPGIDKPDVKGESYWWPRQPLPKGLVTCSPVKNGGESALLHSLSGLVAQAQKQGVVDELIWHETTGDYPLWYAKVIDRTMAEERGTFSIWELLERYMPLVRGYILYQPETNRQYRENMNFSIHAAMAWASIIQGVVIDETLEPQAVKMGLKLLKDAGHITMEDCFVDLKDSMADNMVVTMNPFYMNNYDLAVAGKAFITYGVNDITETIIARSKPLSPVVGWNHGNEDDFTRLPTKYGLFNTASDWCNNLITLSAGSEHAEFEKIKTLNPSEIDFSREGPFHSFVMSDGDNMQWTIGSFVRNKNFWGSPLHGSFPVGFTSCPVNLSQMAPDVLDEMAKTQPPHTTVIEYGGGYQYPDIFAVGRGAGQAGIQRRFAGKINDHMKRTGTKVFGFICLDVDSSEAIDAYRIYAEEIEDLVGMLAVQYDPYHGGKGKIIWVKNKTGVEIPVVTATFSLWQGLQTEGGGDIATISNLINKTAEENAQSLNWTVVHAWSVFQNPLHAGESAGGLKAVKWCIDNLDDEIKIISPEELLWRIRMAHNPAQTREITGDKN